MLNNRLSRGEILSTVRSLAGSLNFWLLALYFIGFGVYFAGMPKMADDYWHIQELRPWFESQGLESPEQGGNFFKAGIPWKEILSTWEWRYNYDNLRLTTLLLVFFLMMPKWIGSFLSLGFWIYAVVRGLRLAGIDVLRSPLVPFAMVIYYVLMPWQVCLGSLSYQFSYLVASGMAVWLFSRILKGKRGIFRTSGTALLGFVLGWWHEGLGGPVACGVLTIFLLRKGDRTGAASALLGLLAGTSINVFSPGLFRRGAEQMPVTLMDWSVVQSWLWQEWMLFVSIVLLIAGLLSRRWRNRNLGKIWIWYMGATCLSSLMLLIIIPQGARVGWACALFSVPLGLGLLRTLIPGITEKYTAVTAVMGLIVCGVLFTGLGMIGVESFRLRSLHSRLVKEVREYPETNGFFEEYRYRRDLSPLMAGMPERDFYTTCTRFLSHYYRDAENGQRVYCIPKELEYVTSRSGEPVPGEGGFRRIGNKYYAPCPEALQGLKGLKVWIDFGKGYTNAYCFVGAFISKGDGKRYIFLDPTLDWYVAHFKRIQGIGKVYDPEHPEKDYQSQN